MRLAFPDATIIIRGGGDRHLTASIPRHKKGQPHGREPGAYPVNGSLNEHLLEERCAALEVARAWKPRVLSRLESLIRNGTDRELFRINPLTQIQQPTGFNGRATPPQIP